MAKITAYGDREAICLRRDGEGGTEYVVLTEKGRVLARRSVDSGYVLLRSGVPAEKRDAMARRFVEYGYERAAVRP